MRSDLTSKQAALLDYIRQAIARDGRTPSLRQTAKDLGVSHAAVSQMVKALEEKGYGRRDGRYSRTFHVVNRAGLNDGVHNFREVPVIGAITAGLPLYAQEEWDGSLVVDRNMFRGQYLFALKVQGDSMTGAGILNGDFVICEARQYAKNGEIVVALIGGTEATVKRFYLRENAIELRPENPAYEPRQYDFAEILVQGKVMGVVRGPDITGR